MIIPPQTLRSKAVVVEKALDTSLTFINNYTNNRFYFANIIQNIVIKDYL